MSQVKFSNCTANKSSNDLILHHNNIMHKYDLRRDMHEGGMPNQAKEMLKCGWLLHNKSQLQGSEWNCRANFAGSVSGSGEICMGRGLSLGSGRMTGQPSIATDCKGD